MKKTISIKEICGKLISYATNNGNEPVQVFNDFLRFSCDVMDIEEVIRCNGLNERVRECWKQNPLFFECFVDLCNYILKENKNGHSCDGFGKLYVSYFHKNNLCIIPHDAMREFMNGMLSLVNKNDNVNIYNDYACGSGGIMLDVWEKCDKNGKNFFSCQDSNPTFVMMCAFNFLINGMVGTIECQDALSGAWYFGYVVNSVKVHLFGDFRSIQRVEDKDEFMMFDCDIRERLNNKESNKRDKNDF